MLSVKEQFVKNELPLSKLNMESSQTFVFETLKSYLLFLTNLQAHPVDDDMEDHQSCM
jgi:hypothetical protein